jgi:hypothetical protein
MKEYFLVINPIAAVIVLFVLLAGMEHLMKLLMEFLNQIKIKKVYLQQFRWEQVMIFLQHLEYLKET